MQSTSILPCLPLRPFIKAYMISSVGQPGQLLDLDLYPVGHSILVFILNENHFIHNIQKDKYYRVRFTFTGQLKEYNLLHTSYGSMVYVMFQPYGAYRLLGIPQHLLADESTDMGDMLTGDINTLTRRMEDTAKDPFAVVTLLEEWLLKQFQKNGKTNSSRIAYACNKIVASAGSLSVKELCSITHMSKSSLEQRFKEQVGLTTKMFSRVMRFNAVRQELSNCPDTDWQELAYRFGYFDQSHFIHEFKHFFGYTPSKAHLSDKNLASHITTVLADVEDPLPGFPA